VRTIPLPVFMVGAGLYFAGSKSGQKLTQQASDAAADFADNASEFAGTAERRAQEISGEVGRRVQDLGDQLGERASTAKDYVIEGIERTSDAVSAGGDGLRRRADAVGAAMASGADDIERRAEAVGASVAGHAAHLKDKSVAMAGSAAGVVQDVAMGAASVARKKVGTAADASLEAAKTARKKASELADRASKSFSQTLEQNPLLVAGVGLLIGGLIASALPRTDLEDGVIGGASTAAKRRAREAAAHGIDTAKQAAGQSYDNVSSQAEAEGLTPEAIEKVAQTLGQRVRRVADTAVNTAFEQPSRKVPTNGEKNHD
jgi:hypothetical protein